MKYAIISDIHGNLEACEAVFADLTLQGCTKVLCLGDIIGYGANPRECIDLIRQKTDVCVAGNHDWGAVGNTELTYFNAAARSALEWAMRRLDAGSMQFLANLPLIHREKFFTIIHATPLEPKQWNYIFSEHEALVNLRVLDHQLCFVGHSHIPTVFMLTTAEDFDYVTSFETIPVEGVHRCIINVGSVGQPRDKNPRASYGILDTDQQVFTLRRVSYDIQKTQEKILAAGLPPVLAERLSFGW